MKRSLNLMSERSRKRAQVRCCVRFWSRIFAGVLLMLTVAGLAQWRKSYLEQSKQASAEAEYEPIRQMRIEASRLRKQIATLQDTERVALELAKNRPLLGLIALATRAVAEHDKNVYLQRIDIEREPLAGQPKQKSALTFALEGLSVDSTAVTRLADSLRELGPFTAVEISTNSTSRVGKQEQLAFSIQCTD